MEKNLPSFFNVAERQTENSISTAVCLNAVEVQDGVSFCSQALLVTFGAPTFLMNVVNKSDKKIQILYNSLLKQPSTSNLYTAKPLNIL
jgi:hypothetical protein